MKRFRKYLHYSILILVGTLTSTITKADVWDTPKVKTYYSENKEYKLIITPTRTPSKYWLWDYYKKGKYPTTKKILRQKERFMRNLSSQDTIPIPCRAELYQINDTSNFLIWKKNLLNYVCPTYAIVANDGSSMVTINNWYMRGYGVNVFVVYNEKGEAKRTYKLEEISPIPLNDYFSTTSSLDWCKNIKFIDNERVEIMFKTEKNIRIYNTKAFVFEEHRQQFLDWSD